MSINQCHGWTTGWLSGEEPLPRDFVETNRRPDEGLEPDGELPTRFDSCNNAPGGRR